MPDWVMKCRRLPSATSKKDAIIFQNINNQLNKKQKKRFHFLKVGRITGRIRISLPREYKNNF